MKRSVRRQWAAALSLLMSAGCVDRSFWEQSSDNAPGKNSLLTREFEQIHVNGSAPVNLAKSVARIHPDFKEIPPFTVVSVDTLGTAVLLDRQGTVGLTGHQTNFISKKEVLLVFVDPVAHGERKYKAIVDFVDKKLDIAFATIQDKNFRTAVQHDWVRPLKWGRTQLADQSLNRYFILGGFPGFRSRRLHATVIRPEGLLDHLRMDIGFEDCKMWAYGKSYVGLSGGVITDDEKDDQFLGILNGSVGYKIFPSYVVFTPSEAIYKSYQIHYPDRARDNPFPGSLDDIPDSCKDHAVSFRPKAAQGNQWAVTVSVNPKSQIQPK